MNDKKCGYCANFLGMGDWDLCCNDPPDEDIGFAGHLCYADTTACRKYTPKCGEWIIVHPTDVFTMVPVWQCSSCKQLTSGYTPDKICPNCESKNKEAVNKHVELAISELEGW